MNSDTTFSSLARLTVLFGGVFVFSGCSPLWFTDHNEDKRPISLATGAVVGGAAGAIIGSESGDGVTGATIGTALGASTGYLLSEHFDSKKIDFEARQRRIGNQNQQIQEQGDQIRDLRELSVDSVQFDGVEQAPAQASSISERSIELDAPGLSANQPSRVTRDSAGVLGTYEGDIAAQQGFAALPSQPKAQLRVSGMQRRVEPIVPDVPTARQKASGRIDLASLPSAPRDPRQPQVVRSRTAGKTSLTISSIGAQEPVDAALVKQPKPLGALSSAVTDPPVAPAKKVSLSDTQPIQERAAEPRFVEKVGVDSEQPQVDIPNRESVAGLVAEPEEDYCNLATASLDEAERSSVEKTILRETRRALRYCPENVDVHFRAARIYADLGRNEDAVRESHQVLKLSPRHTETLRLLMDLEAGMLDSTNS